MTKKAMIDYIETTKLVLDFDRNYLMKQSKTYIERIYNHCKKVMENKQWKGVDKPQTACYNKL